MSRLKETVFHFFSPLLQCLLKGLILLAFRPQKRFVSDKAKAEAFNGPCVLISNHVRGMDGGVIFTMLPGVKVTGLVAKDMTDNSPALRRFLALLPTMPIDRQNTSLSWLRESRRLLKGGESIYLCPEGKCNFDRVTQPFKSGCVLLAAMAGVPIVPIYHNGIYHYLFGKRWRMMVGEPITVTPPPEGLTEEELNRQAALLYRRVQELEIALTGELRIEETLKNKGKR